eukprot:703452-Rhodomonas_salina.1
MGGDLQETCACACCPSASTPPKNGDSQKTEMRFRFQFCLGCLCAWFAQAPPMHTRGRVGFKALWSATLHGGATRHRGVNCGKKGDSDLEQRQRAREGSGKGERGDVGAQ